MTATHFIGNRDIVARSILETLAYFDVFRHPLTLEEIRQFNRIPDCFPDFIEQTVSDLADSSLVKEFRGFYFLGTDTPMVDDRIKSNLLAQKRMKAAWIHSFIISRFPFVRAVFISGSLSKGVMDPDDDIDYFIITEPGRLWISRVLLTLFKRVFLLNSHRNFCLNYFIDTEHLAIPEHNIFTATEVGTILPMYNRDLYHRFLKENSWYHDYYPNMHINDNVRNSRGRLAGVLAEKLLGGKAGDRVDEWCMRITRKFLEQKYRNMTPERFQSDLESSKGVSKHHPNRQQFRILKEYQEKIKGFTNLLPGDSIETGRSFDLGKSG
jgi:hypothetical protein